MSHISLLFFKDVTTSRSTLSRSSSSRGLGRVAQERRAPLAATRQHYNSKTCRNNSLCRIRFDVGFEIIEAKRMGTLLRTHHDTLPGRVLNMSTHRPSSSVSAQTEELPCHKPPHLSKSQILCCLSVNRTPIGSKELTTAHGTPGISTHWPLSSLMLSRPLLIR